MENLGPYDAGVPFRKFIFVFLLVCIVVGAGVFYSALSKASITIIPKSSIKEVSTDVVVDSNLNYPDLDKGLLNGEIKTKELDSEDTISEVVPKKIDEVARGKVTIHNNTPYPQGIRQGAPMRVAGAPEGIIFATIDRHTIPPKQSKEVDVVATFKGAKGNLPAGTKFEFLNLTTQYMRDNVWAENTDKIDGGVREAKIVLNDDLERAYTNLANKQFKKTIEEMNNNLGDGKVIKEESARYVFLDKKSSVSAGTETDSFNVQIKIRVEGVTINENDLKNLVQNKLQAMGESNEEFVKYEPDSFSYELTQLNMDEKKAYLKVKMKGEFRSKLSSKVFDKKSVIGYNEQAIKEHFDHFDNISGIKVNFWPPFRKTVPNVENRIEINVSTD